MFRETGRKWGDGPHQPPYMIPSRSAFFQRSIKGNRVHFPPLLQFAFVPRIQGGGRSKLYRQLGLTMGLSSPDLYFKGMTVEDEGICSYPRGPLWKNALKLRALKRQQKKLSIRRKMGVHRCYRRPKIIIKRRASGKGVRMHLNGVERRIRVLQRLLPNGNSVGLDGLLLMAADYILRLEMQVHVLQTMVKVFSDSN